MLFFEIANLFKTGLFLAGSAFLLREISCCLEEMIWDDDDNKVDR